MTKKAKSKLLKARKNDKKSVSLKAFDDSEIERYNRAVEYNTDQNHFNF